MFPDRTPIERRPIGKQPFIVVETWFCPVLTVVINPLKPRTWDFVVRRMLVKSHEEVN